LASEEYRRPICALIADRTSVTNHWPALTTTIDKDIIMATAEVITLSELSTGYDPFGPKLTFPQIAAEYAPYHTMLAFQVGAEDYMDSHFQNPFGSSSVEAQAWDRGAEAASRFTHQHLH
jgi:hypothetical protein